MLQIILERVLFSSVGSVPYNAEAVFSTVIVPDQESTCSPPYPEQVKVTLQIFCVAMKVLEIA